MNAGSCIPVETRSGGIIVKEQDPKKPCQSAGTLALTMLPTMAAALAALYGIPPDDIGNIRWISLVVFAGVGITYWILMVVQWSQWRDQEKAAPEPPSDAPLQQRLSYVLTNVSTFRTRWLLATDILQTKELDDADRTRFERIRDEWDRRLREIDEANETLLNDEQRSEDDYARVKLWLSAWNDAKAPKDE